MTWTNIFNNEDLVRSYNAFGIPSVYLIDPQGFVIYSRDEDNDIHELQVLKSC